jgi:hypothetical protein
VPAVDCSLHGRHIAFRWNTGWELGMVKWYKKPYLGKFNTEIAYASGERHDTLLRAEFYGCNDAKAGSWVVLSESG